MGKKKKVTEEEEKNIYHKEYGVFHNVAYIWKMMVKYEPVLILLIFGSVIIHPTIVYLWTFMGKLVIDVVTRQGEVRELLILILVTFSVQLVATMLESTINQQDWLRFINARFKVMEERSYKIMTMNFQYLEDSDVMDCCMKAMNATGNNDNGVEGMMHQIEYILRNIATVVIGLMIMGTLSMPIVIGMTALAVINFLIKKRTGAVTKKKIWDPLATWWRKDNYMEQTMTDFGMAKDIRMFGLKNYLVKKYWELNEERLTAAKKNALAWWITGQIGNLLWILSQAALYAWLVYRIATGDMTIGNFTLYLGAAASFFQYILSLFDNMNSIIERSREIDDYRSFMDIDTEDAKEHIPLPKFDSYEFTFENVSFQYPKAEKYALKNLTLTLKAGERLAVVGLNGAGKSTFIKLLLRLYEPTEGRILLNGMDITSFDKTEYYRLFAPVFQDVFLYAFPLSENISMACPENTDKALAEESLKLAGMEEKLASLPAGVDTEVLKIIFDDGVDFSGGEKQKIALARALYKNAPIVVLDEPTAALDAIAESKLYQDFDKLIGGKTAVYISHRLSSTQFCAHVAMFVDGELKEYGTHESLMEKGGAYSEMFKVQAQYYVEGGNEDGQKEEND